MTVETATPSIEIRRLAGEPDGSWDDLALRAGSPWQSRAYAALHAEFGVSPFFLEASAGGRPLGGVSGWVVGSRRAPFLDRPFARAVLVPDEPLAVERAEEVLPLCLDAVEREARRLSAVSVAWRAELPRNLAPEELARRGYSVTPYGVAVIDLPSDAAGLDACMDRTARRQARKALKLGVRVEQAAGVEPLLPLLDLSFRRAGLPARNHAFVRRAQELLGGEVLVAANGPRPLAALLWAPFGTTGLNMFHGRADGDTQGASELLHREMFVRAIARGVRVLHTGGAALPGEPADARLGGISLFKTKMGFQVRPAFHATLVLRPAAHALRRRALRLWSSLRRSSRGTQ